MRLPRSARVSVAAIATMLALVLAVPSTAGAASKSDTQARKGQVDSEVAAVAEDLAGTSAELSGAYTKLAEAKGQLPAAQAALDQAKAVEAEAERKDAELAGRLAAAEQAQAQAQKKVDGSATQLKNTQAEMGRLAASAYRRGTASTEWSVVMQSESPDDFADRYVLADTVMRGQAGTMSNIAERQAVQENAQTRLQAVKGEVSDLREEARQALKAAEDARRDAATKKSEVDRLVADAAAATATIESRKAEEEAQLGALKAEQDRLSAQLAEIARQEKAAAAAAAAKRASSKGAGKAPAAPADPGPPPSGGGVLSKPIEARITSNFGYRIHPIYHYRRLHAGTDFGAACGTPIRAAADGRVVSAGWGGGYGNRIVVAHGLVGGNSIATTYNHMSRYAVRSGNVTRGQVIGYVGTTGSSTGCHLHFEVLRNGAHVNPMGYL